MLHSSVTCSHVSRYELGFVTTYQGADASVGLHCMQETKNDSKPMSITTVLLPALPNDESRWV